MHRQNIWRARNYSESKMRKTTFDGCGQNVNSNKMYLHSKSKVQGLLDQTTKLIDDDESAKKRIEILDR